MRRALVVVAFVSSSAFAQAQVQSDKGTVQVGPGGAVKVKGKKGEVTLTPAGTVQATGTKGSAEVRPASLAKDGGATGELAAPGTVRVFDPGALKPAPAPAGGVQAPMPVGAVTRDAPPSAGGKMELTGTGTPLAHTCLPGQRVEVNGAGNTLTLYGECGEVVVNGTGNTGSIEAAQRLEVRGTGNTLTWKRGANGLAEPKVKLKGIGNVVSRAQ